MSVPRRSVSRRNSSSGVAPYRKLKPGPGHSAAKVAANQRARLQAAMIELTGDRGYANFTVDDLVQLAGVSKPTLYKHFGDRDKCFLATYDLIVDAVIRRILASMNPHDDWRQSLRAGFGAFAGQFEENPAAARLALVEVFAAGPPALERMRRMECLFEALVLKGFGRGPDGVHLPPLIAKGIVAGAAQVVLARLANEDGHELGPEVETLTDWALSFADPSAAEICRTEAPSPTSPTPVTAPGWDAEVERVQRMLGSDDRSLILAAVVRLVAVERYSELTVSRICATAGVSRRSFDAQFDGVADCFLAMIGLLGDRALADARPAYASAGDWPTGVHRAIAALCARATRDAVLVRLAFIEIFSPGPVSVPWRSAFMTHASRLLCTGVERARRPSGLAAEASTAAVWAVVRHQIATGQLRRLPRLAPTLSFLVLAPAIGARAASEAILADVRRMSTRRAGSVPSAGLNTVS